ncbi:MAG: cupredoxin domain-containing protein [Solirubrobacteraceae bacterium]
MQRTLLPAALGLALALVAGCGDDSPMTSGAPSASKPTTAIRISNFLYEPDPSVVKAGTKISVSNADGAPHTLTDKGADRTFDSGTIKGGRTGTVTFTQPGTYAYFCEFHPTMAGKVTVTE